MNVTVEYTSSSDEGSRRSRRHEFQSSEPQHAVSIHHTRNRDHFRESAGKKAQRPPGSPHHDPRRGPQLEFIREPSRRRSKDSLHADEYHEASKARKGHRRRTSRKYIESRILPDQQDSDDVLDDYYGGAPPDSAIDVAFDAEQWEDDMLAKRARMSSRPAYTTRYDTAEADVADGFTPPSPVPRPYSTHRPHSSGMPPPLMAYDLPEPNDRRPTYPSGPALKAPVPGHGDGLWARASRPSDTSKPRGSKTLRIKLVLTRKGERFKGRSFQYQTRTSDDIEFARTLTREYRSLKTDQIGMMQKLTSYKTISFVYFLQYRAFRTPKKSGGVWMINKRVPITPCDDEKARSSFMYQLRKKLRRESTLLTSLSEKPRPKKASRDWVNKLDSLAWDGVVIDLEVKETFDAAKIYAGLLLAVLLSLGAALAYGFAMDRDFSTGFSIASWLLTAFGFFAAFVAVGDWLGIESPRASLVAANDLEVSKALGRELYEPHMRSRAID